EAAVDEQRLSRWVRELDHDRFTVREAAARGLEQNLEAAVGLLEQARARGPSAEAARRIDRLLRARRAGGGEARVDKAVRALEYAGGTEARRCLQELAGGREGARVTQAARAALRRLGAAPAK